MTLFAACRVVKTGGRHYILQYPRCLAKSTFSYTVPSLATTLRSSTTSTRSSITLTPKPSSASESESETSKDAVSEVQPITHDLGKTATVASLPHHPAQAETNVELGPIESQGSNNVAAHIVSMPPSTPVSTQSQSPPLPPPPQSPPPTLKKKRRHRLRTFARTVLVIVLSSTGYVVYKAYTDRHPLDQADHDPNKKTIVVLGNGWGATSFLKGLDTSDYNVIVISPRNYFCFTPLLPSVTVGTIDARSVVEPTRFITRHKSRHVHVYEASADHVDPVAKTVTFSDTSDIKGQVSSTTVAYDYLVYAVGAENNTFGIPGVKEHACFLKEMPDAEKIRKKLMDCIESAAFKDQPPEEVDRLLHMVVVGGGPTGVEYAGELHDFLVDDLTTWYPEIAGRFKITLVEALPNVLPMFSKQLIDYTTQTFISNQIEVLTKTMVKKVDSTTITAETEHKDTISIPYGLLVWATGNTTRSLTRQLMQTLSESSNSQNNKRGLVVDEYLRLIGAKDIWALGDCTATAYAPTAQAASQQGFYLAKTFGQLAKSEKIEQRLRQLYSQSTTTNTTTATTPATTTPSGVMLSSQDREEAEKLEKALRRCKVREFHYSHQGSLAYIGSEKAIADLPFGSGNLATGGVATMLFWRSAYVSMAFSFRNRALVCTDWLKVKLFGRDVSRE